MIPVICHAGGHRFKTATITSNLRCVACGSDDLDLDDAPVVAQRKQAAYWVYDESGDNEIGGPYEQYESAKRALIEHSGKGSLQVMREEDGELVPTGDRTSAKRAARGPAGFWCRACGEYQSTRDPAQVRAAKAHIQAHIEAGEQPLDGGPWRKGGARTAERVTNLRKARMETDAPMGKVDAYFPEMGLVNPDKQVSMSQVVRCSNCFFEGTVDASDPAQPMPACPECGAPTLTAAGPTQPLARRRTAEKVVHVRDELKAGDKIVKGPKTGTVESAEYSPQGGGKVRVQFTNGTSHAFNSNTRVTIEGRRQRKTAYSSEGWVELLYTFHNLTGEHLSSSVATNAARAVLDKTGDVVKAALVAASQAPFYRNDLSLMDGMQAHDKAIQQIQAKNASRKQPEEKKDDKGLFARIADWFRGEDGKQEADAVAEARTAKIEEIMAGIQESNPGLPNHLAYEVAKATVDRFPKMVAGRKTADLNPADVGIKVGDFFVSSWGYDQTNVDFYKVVGLTGASVRLQAVRSKTVSTARGADYVVPFDSPMESHYRTTEPFIARLVSPDSVSSPKHIYGGGWASKWDGEPEYQTAAGWGH